jgi:hypothetical protein
MIGDRFHLDGIAVNQALALNNAVERPNPVLDSLVVVKQ